jgi:pimeloyl-ACP methyl ester carboxylesterase
MSGGKYAGELYASAEARAKLLGRYEEALARWPEVTGLQLERLTCPTSAGATTVLAFGPGAAVGGAVRAAGARPLLLLHGALSNSIMWMQDAATLAAGRRVFAVDIPGEPGLSEERPLDWQGSGAAAWLRELAAGIGLVDFDILGLSIGGWISLAYAIGRPAGLRSLALLAPSGIGRPRASFIFKAMLQMPRGRAGREAIARSLFGELEPPAGAIEAGTELSEATRPRMEQPRIFTDEELAGIRARLFLAVGERDVMLNSRESAARLGKLQPDAEVHLLPGAGHALLGLAPLVVDFLNKA